MVTLIIGSALFLWMIFWLAVPYRADLRTHFAKRLVRWSSNWWMVAYTSCMVGSPLEGFFARIARIVGRIALPVAKRLDKEGALDEMVEQGWWG